MGCGSSSDSGVMGASGHGAHKDGNTRSSSLRGGDLGTVADALEAGRSDAIGRELDALREGSTERVRMLLLGPGDSGKSTIFKQMRILHGSPLHDGDLRMYGVIVRSNVVTAMRKLCKLLRDLKFEDQLAAEGMTGPSESAVATADGAGGSSECDHNGCGGGTQPRRTTMLSPKEAYDILVAQLVNNAAGRMRPPPEDAWASSSTMNDSSCPDDRPDDVRDPCPPDDDWIGYSPRAGRAPNADARTFLRLWRPMAVLWDSRTMKEVWMRRAEANVVDGHILFLDDMERIASPEFRPTDRDILNARTRSTTVVTETYRIDGVDFEICDVGGQRSERRKWIDCFDNVDAVIFVVALSEYDQTLGESKMTNRMVESLALFRSVCNHKAFANSSILLFLNKMDLFAEKILHSDIRKQGPFQDYHGSPGEFQEGVMYFIHRFKKCLMKDEIKDSYVHVTCATDTDNIKFVMNSVRESIRTENLRRSGFFGSG
jgi:GTPase SAR1 family protein